MTTEDKVRLLEDQLRNLQTQLTNVTANAPQHPDTVNNIKTATNLRRVRGGHRGRATTQLQAADELLGAAIFSDSHREKLLLCSESLSTKLTTLADLDTDIFPDTTEQNLDEEIATADKYQSDIKL